jgi:hypothetical protein
MLQCQLAQTFYGDRFSEHQVCRDQRTNFRQQIHVFLVFLYNACSDLSRVIFEVLYGRILYIRMKTNKLIIQTENAALSVLTYNLIILQPRQYPEYIFEKVITFLYLR